MVVPIDSHAAPVPRAIITVSVLVNAGIVQAVLQHEGITAEIAGNESDLVQFIAGGFCDVLIMVDGQAQLGLACRQILKDNPQIPLLALTGADLFQYRLVRADLGSEGWLLAIKNAFDSAEEMQRR